MDCIAKSIGLIQPPLSQSGDVSLQASPALLPTTDPYGYGMFQSFPSSFSSLSMLQTADDASSVTGNSTTWRDGEGVDRRSTAMENEIKILFFKSGDTLVHAGERNAGMEHGCRNNLAQLS
jgi:lysophospholipid hydrolase